MAPNGEIETVAHRIEVGHGSAHSHAVQVVRRRYADTGRVGAIRILCRAEPLLQTGRAEGVLDVGDGT